MSKTVLALSRDGGSVQTIIPVLQALQGREDVLLKAYAHPQSLRVWASSSINAARWDEASFQSDPAAFMAALFDSARPDLLLCGSSPARGPVPETPEQYALLEARKRSVPSLSILDYWGMYKERFDDPVRKELIPDHLCVLDQRCYDSLKALGVPQNVMTVTHNPWIDRVAKEAARPRAVPAKRDNALHVLFISQPLAEMKAVRSWGYDQEEMFADLVAALAARPCVGTHSIKIWTHPNEDRARWSNLQAYEQPNVRVILEDERDRAPFVWADCVVSSHSTMIYEALYFDVPCVSYRPRGEGLEPLWTDEAGLSVLLTSQKALESYIRHTDFSVDKQRVASRRRTLTQQGLFFSDGHATERVVKVIEKILGTE